MISSIELSTVAKQVINNIRESENPLTCVLVMADMIQEQGTEKDLQAAKAMRNLPHLISTFLKEEEIKSDKIASHTELLLRMVYSPLPTIGIDTSDTKDITKFTTFFYQEPNYGPVLLSSSIVHTFTE